MPSQKSSLTCRALILGFLVNSPSAQSLPIPPTVAAYLADNAALDRLLRDKYFVAGESARCMFGRNTKVAMERLVDHLDTVINMQVPLDGFVGNKSISHDLFCNLPKNERKY